MQYEGAVDPDTVVPFSKNPTIAKFFAQLSWVEELGSGMMNIGKYLPFYSPCRTPGYANDLFFATVIPLPYEQVAEQVTGDVTPKYGKRLMGVFSADFRANFSVDFRKNEGLQGSNWQQMTGGKKPTAEGRREEERG